MDWSIKHSTVIPGKFLVKVTVTQGPGGWCYGGRDGWLYDYSHDGEPCYFDTTEEAETAAALCALTGWRLYDFDQPTEGP